MDSAQGGRAGGPAPTREDAERVRAAGVAITFRAGRAPDAEGRQWVMVELPGVEPMLVGFVQALGDGVAAHAGAGWPRVDICADETRALCAVIGAWGREVATGPEGDDDDS